MTRLPRRAHVLFAWLLLAGVTAALLSGFFRDVHAFGAHDWDQAETHRYFVGKSLRLFGQFPFWDPYACGGAPAFGSPEGGEVVSPFLPVYLFLPLGAAVRVEVVALVALLVAGTWFFARKYVTEPLALAFACLVGALNSRTALQAGVGHAWHLYYAGLPWVLGAFDRALEGEAVKRRWVLLGAAVLALMIYAGGIYPVPHTGLALAGLAAYRARAGKTWRPLLVAAAIPVWATFLAAPKALAVVETMSRFPRHIESHEHIDPLSLLQMFTWGGMPFGKVRSLDYMWHEYGEYVGALPFALVAWAVVQKVGGGTERRSLRVMGLVFMVLGLGGIGPWDLLHMLPVFRSQHVPSRFTYPGLLLLGVFAASVLEERVAGLRGRVEQTSGRERLLGAGAWAAFALSAGLVAREDARCTHPWFDVAVPSVPERMDDYVQYDEVPRDLFYGDGDPESTGGINRYPSLLAHVANVGTIHCTTFPGLNHDAPKGPDGRPLLLGARGRGDPLYQGEVRVEGAGRASIVRWTPNEVEVAVTGAHEGDALVLNQNWAPGWSANGVPAANRAEVVASVLAAGDQTVKFRYRPRTLPVGLALLAVGLLAAPAAWRFRRA